MNKFPKSLRKFVYPYITLLYKNKVSEPVNSVKFILLKSFGFSLKHYYFFYKHLVSIRSVGKVFHLVIKTRNFKIRFLYYLSKRLKDYPIQYILGEWYFRDFIAKCRKPVLIPRIETEMIVDIVKKQSENYIYKNKKNIPHKNLKFLEIGIGTGVIFISLLREFKINCFSCSCVGIDIDKRCVELSKLNAQQLLPKHSNSYSFDFKILHMDFNEYLANFLEETNKFDFIVSNPPYIKSQDERVMKDVIKYESHKALFSGYEGLDLIKEIIKNSRKLVKKGGFVVLEIDPDQKDTIFDILIKEKFTYFLFENDLFNRCRFAIFYIN